ncbi:MAG: filamentous hemagglutinin N-terminal domain-containing protein, partial [Rhodocyclaceae bacterium]|nr:filamentous hemagglutinin N-terminal domain-containing protein [Rhodocyclaceae bacterium]
MRHRPSRFRPHPLALALLAVLSPLPVAANPLNPSVAAGSASFASSGRTLTVTNTNGAVINWQAFSIAAGETTRFVQPTAASQVLNRVTGGDPSQILGTLLSNGRVFLVNPNGIVFGRGARVDVAALVASTLDISNSDFLAGRLKFSGGGAGNLRNDGELRAASQGRIVLIAPQIENNGLIEAPNGEVMLAAGRKVSLVDLNYPDIEFDVAAPANQAINLGQVLASKVGVYASVISAGGRLDASAAVVGPGGKIILKAADSTTLSGTLKAGGDSGGSVAVLGKHVDVDASANIDVSAAQGGGSILIGGDARGANPDVANATTTRVAAGATLRADATAAGNGGKIVVWADDTTAMSGTLSARGGVYGGDGGSAEVSGKAHVAVDGHADLSAPLGKAGTLLLDPGSISISTGASNAATGNVQNSWVSTQLGLSNLVLDTTDASLTSNGATQNITVNAPIAWANTNSLTLNAGSNIAINSSITSTGGNVTLNGASVSFNGNGLVDLGGGTLASGSATALSSAALANLVFTSAGTITGGGSSLTKVTLGDASHLTQSLSGSFVVNGDLTLADSAIVNAGGASLYFASPGIVNIRTVTPAAGATVTLGNGALYSGYGVSGQFLDINAGITIQGRGTLSEYYSVNSIVNHGTLDANVAGQTLTVNPTTFTNAGSVRASGGTLTLSPTSFSNSGTISETGGTLNLNTSLTLANLGAISRSGGQFNLASNSVLDLGGGTLDIGAATFGTGGLTTLNGMVMNGTVISGDGTVLAGNGTLSNITFGSAAAASFTSSGSFSVYGDLRLANGATLNTGSAYWYFRSAGTQNIKAVSGSATINRTGGVWYAGYGISGQTLDINAGVTMQGYGNLDDSSLATIVNHGTLDANTSGQTFTVRPNTFNNAGTLRASGGTLSVGPATFRNSGDIVETGGSINLNTQTTLADLAGISRSGGTFNINGTVDLGGGTLDIGAATFGTGGLTTLDGTVVNGTLISGDGTVLAGNGSLSNITFGSAAAASFTSSGNFSVYGDLRLANGATLNTGAGYWYFRSAGTQNITAVSGSATINRTGGYWYAGYGISGQTLDINAGVSMRGYGNLDDSSVATIVNHGTLDANTSGQTFSVHPSTFNNAGTVRASGGTLSLSPTNFSNTG